MEFLAVIIVGYLTGLATGCMTTRNERMKQIFKLTELCMKDGVYMSFGADCETEPARRAIKMARLIEEEVCYRRRKRKPKPQSIHPTAPHDVYGIKRFTKRN